jgi:arylsulfatase A-like enzyme
MKQSYSKWSCSLRESVDLILSWVIFGSFLGAIEGIWQVNNWNSLNPGNLQHLIGFNAEKTLFVFSALFLYGILFGLIRIISLVLTRILFPSLSLDGKYSVQISLGFCLFFILENIIAILPRLHIGTILLMGELGFLYLITWMGNWLIRKGKEQVFISWMSAMAMGLATLFVVIWLRRIGWIYWMLARYKLEVVLVFLILPAVIILLIPRLENFYVSRPFSAFRQVTLAAFALGAFIFGAFFNSLFLFRHSAPCIYPSWYRSDKPNVILIVVDTLRADHLGLYGYPKRTSPHLDKWAENGMVFERAVAPSSWTLPSTYSILTGRYPQRHGMLKSNNILKPTLPILPRILSEQGYLNAAFVGNHVISNRSDFLKNFDSFDGEFNGRKFGEILFRRMVLTRDVSNLIINDTRLTYRTKRITPINVINRLVDDWLYYYGNNPFFLYIHYMDPHDPYNPHEKELKNTLVLDDPFEDVLQKIDPLSRSNMNNYDCEIRFLDNHLNRLFSKLKSLGIWDKSLVIFTSDHGETFGEHGYQNHGNSLYQEEVHVPLIFFSTRQFPIASDRFTPFVSTVDITPTILDLLGIKKEIDSDGLALTSWLQNPGITHVRDVYSFLHRSKRGLPKNIFQAVYTENQWKYITTQRIKSSEILTKEMYDLKVDSTEQTNLAGDRLLIQKTIERKLSRHKRIMAKKQVISPTAPLSPALQSALRSLGYLN